MAKSRIANELRCPLPAETILLNNDQQTKTRKAMNAIEMTIDVLCRKWNSVCFVLVANTCICLVVAAVHQHRTSEEGLVALSFQSLEVAAANTPPVLLESCQPFIQPYATCKFHMRRSAYIC